MAQRSGPRELIEELKSLLNAQVAAAAQAGAFLHVVTSTNATGWDASIIAGLPAGQASAFLYLCDPTAEILWLTTIASVNVPHALAGFKKAGYSGSSVRDTLGSAFDYLPPDAALPPGFSREEVNAIAAGSALAYASETQTWAQMGGVADGAHLVILRYRRAENDWLLRPFALRGHKDKPIAADVLAGSVRQVIAIDRQRHLDWFPKTDFSDQKGSPR